MKDTTAQAIEAFRLAISERTSEAKLEEIRDDMEGYDGYVLIRLPSDWTPGRVREFEDWAREQAYNILMDLDVDLRVEAYNLTRNQQELVKWIYVHYPDVQEEDLPNSKVVYDRDAARDLFQLHGERIEERLIAMSGKTQRDQDMIKRKYQLRYGT